MSAFPDTPVTLLARIAAQVTGRDDEAAWVRLFELYEPAIRKFAAHQGGGDESEDVAQEIFLRLVEVLRGGKYSADAGKFRSYLATLIRRELPDRRLVQLEEPHPRSLVVPAGHLRGNPRKQCHRRIGEGTHERQDGMS